MHVFSVLMKILLEIKDFLKSFAVRLIEYVFYIYAIHSKELKEL